MATVKAIAFSARVRAAATALEIAYRIAKRISQEWYALSMASDIPFDNEPLVDGDGARPLTNMGVYHIINRCDELVAAYEANNNAVLNTVIQASQAPADWR